MAEVIVPIGLPPANTIMGSLLRKLNNVRPDADGWVADCPSPDHDGQIVRLDVWAGEGGEPCARCDEGCESDVLREVLFPPPSKATRARYESLDDSSLPSLPEDGKGAGSPWGIQTAKAFLARVFPPTRFLYLDLVPADSVTVLMSPPNAGKTFFALDIAAQVAAAAAKSGLRVIIVEEEGAGAALQERLRRALKASGADPELVGIAWNTGLSLLNASMLSHLAGDCEGADLVILDSLAALCEDVDENDSKAMGQVARALRMLQTASGAAVLALHHMTKEGWKEGEKPALRHMRGHSKLPGRVDTALALVPGDSDALAVRFELHVLKQRDGGERPKARRVEVSMVGDSADVTISDLEHVVQQSAASKRVADLLHVVLVKIPTDVAVTRDFIVDAVGKREQDVRKAVGILIDQGKVRELSRGRLMRASTQDAGRQNDP